jgi:hypothetical protein
MVQGGGKLGKAQKTKGGVRHKAGKGVVKGRRVCDRKSNHTSFSSTADLETTKTINKKNEVMVAAKAVSVGDRFFLSEMATKGKMEVKKQLKARNKRQGKVKLSNRLKDQLAKMGKGVK